MSFGSGGSNNKQVVKPKYTKQQKEILNAGQPAVVNYVKQGGANITGAPTATPELNATQQAAIQAAQTAAGGNLGQLSEYATRGVGTLTDPNILYADSNPALRSYMDAAVQPLYENLTEVALPGIRSEAAGVGQLGMNSNRQGIAEGLAIKGTQRAAGAVTSGIANQGYLAGLDALSRGVTGAGTAANVAGAPADLLSRAGAIQYNQQAAENQEAYNRYMYQQMAPFLAAQQGANYATGLGVGQTTTAVPGSPSTPAAILGGAAQGYALTGNPWGAVAGGAAGGIGSLI